MSEWLLKQFAKLPIVCVQQHFAMYGFIDRIAVARNAVLTLNIFLLHFFVEKQKKNVKPLIVSLLTLQFGAVSLSGYNKWSLNSVHLKISSEFLSLNAKKGRLWTKSTFCSDIICCDSLNYTQVIYVSNPCRWSTCKHEICHPAVGRLTQTSP